MKSLSTSIRVGVLFVLLTVGSYLVWKNLGQNPAGKDNYTLFAKFRDASGLPKGTKVVVAGLPKGEVVGLEVEGRYAKVTFKVDNEITVWTSAVIIKKARSLLGDNYLEIDPGEEIKQAADGTRQTFTKLGPACPTYRDSDRRKSDACRQIPNWRRSTAATPAASCARGWIASSPSSTATRVRTPWPRAARRRRPSQSCPRANPGRFC